MCSATHRKKTLIVFRKPPRIEEARHFEPSKFLHCFQNTGKIELPTYQDHFFVVGLTWDLLDLDMVSMRSRDPHSSMHTKTILLLHVHLSCNSMHYEIWRILRYKDLFRPLYTCEKLHWS